MITNSNHKDVLPTLQRAGISKTSQRVAVLDILFKAKTPLSVNAIRQAMETKAHSGSPSGRSSRIPKITRPPASNIVCLPRPAPGDSKSRAIDKVTVYRILSLFRQRGIIREIASAGGVSYFERATLENPLHPHFNCRNCGAFTCLAPLSFSQPPELILSKDEYSIDHIEINISGLCSCCRNATSQSKSTI
jgi:Fur family transcriptional regulator, ferric uptake regulator